MSDWLPQAGGQGAVRESCVSSVDLGASRRFAGGFLRLIRSGAAGVRGGAARHDIKSQ